MMSEADRDKFIASRVEFVMGRWEAHTFDKAELRRLIANEIRAALRVSNWRIDGTPTKIARRRVVEAANHLYADADGLAVRKVED